MHGAHPSHLAFKLLDLLSLSPYFSPSRPFALLFAVRAMPFSLSHMFQRTCAASGTFLPLSSASAQLRFRLCLSRGISAPSLVSQNFPTTSLDLVRCSTPPHLLIFYSASWHRDKNARTCFRTLENAAAPRRAAPLPKG